jgi:CysZ protein
VGFFRGLVAPFRGAAYVLRNGYTRYLVLPLIIDAILATATMFAAYHYCKAELGEWLIHWPWLGGILLVVTTGLVGVVLFLIAQPLLLAAFADTLSERVERDVLGTAATVPFVSSVGKSIAHGLLKVVLYGLALAISAVLFAVTGGPGVVVGLALGGLSMAYDGFDYPLARRNASFGAKWAYLARNPGLTIGYGIGTWVFYLIPFVVFVAPPVVAAGATLAFIDTERKRGRLPAAPVGAKSGEGKSLNVAANT